MNQLLFQTVIPGRVVSKKNSKRIVSIGGNSKRQYVIPSEAYLVWSRHALVELRQQRIMNLSIALSGPLELEIRFYFQNHQHELDLDNCLGGPLDVLQKAGIIENDKQIVAIRAEKHFGHEPRTEIKLFKHEGE